MNYNLDSIDTVVAKILRNTGVKDSHYIQDILEWIAEGVDLLKTNAELISDVAEEEVIFHKCWVPCGCRYIKAIEYNGRRLPYNNSSRDLRECAINTLPASSFENTFTTFPTVNPTVDGNYTWNSKATQDNIPAESDPTASYQLDGNSILTSFPAGKIKIHYKRIALDKNGMPLIPSNGDYKEALYFFVRGRMAGAGFEDKVYSIRELHDLFELHAGRAIADVEYPTPDQVETSVNATTRLIPIRDYWNNFFNTPFGEEQYSSNATNPRFM